MKCSPSSFACFGEIKIQIATEIVLISTLLVLYVNFLFCLAESQTSHFNGLRLTIDQYRTITLVGLSIKTTHILLLI